MRSMLIIGLLLLTACESEYAAQERRNIEALNCQIEANEWMKGQMLEYEGQLIRLIKQCVDNIGCTHTVEERELLTHEIREAKHEWRVKKFECNKLRYKDDD